MKELITYSDRITLDAVVLVAIGLILRYFIGKRRFNRRGIAGMQYYNNYKQALITTTIERLANIIASLLIVAGIILYLIK